MNELLCWAPRERERLGQIINLRKKEDPMGKYDGRKRTGALFASRVQRAIREIRFNVLPAIRR